MRWVLLCLLLLPAFAASGCKDAEKPNSEDDDTTDFNVPIAAITMDGSADDWAGIAPAAMDAEGDDASALSGADAKGLYFAQSPDHSMIYVMMNFWDGPPSSVLASGSTSDGDAQHPDALMGYQVFFDANNDGTHDGEMFVRYDELSGGWYAYSFGPGTPHTVLAVGSVLEFAFPWTTLGSPAQTYVLGCVDYSAWSDRREYVPDLPTWVRLRFAP